MATAKRQEYVQKYREANAEQIRAADRARYAANKASKQAAMKAYREANAAELAEKKRAYREAAAEALRAKDRAYYLANREAIAERRRQYRKLRSSVVAASNRLRQSAKLRRTPAWLTPDDLWLIRQAYELARLRTQLFGFAWHVDHIYPLQGKTVSGLHVPTNLQVIPATENCRKNNKC